MKYYYTGGDAPCGHHEMGLGHKRVFNLKEKERPEERGENKTARDREAEQKIR